MPTPTPAQLKKLERLAKVLDNGDVELLRQLDDLESQVTAQLSDITAVVQTALAVAEQTKKLQGEPGYTPVKGKDYFDGEPGKDYILTETDKKQIAKSIPVPVVEKVIVKEQPIVTNQIVKETTQVEVAVLDEATVAYLEAEIKRLESLLSNLPGRGSMIGLAAVQREIDQKLIFSDTEPENPRLYDIWINLA